MSENLPENNISQNTEERLAELCYKLIGKFSNPQDVVQEILRCTEEQLEETKFIIQKILISEYPNDIKQEKEWIEELVQGGLIKQWVETNLAEVSSSSETHQESDYQELQQEQIAINNVQENLENDTRATSLQTKILSGGGIAVFCIVTFFLWPKNVNQEQINPVTKIQCNDLQIESFIDGILTPSLNRDTPINQDLRKIDRWLDNEGTNLDETCKNQLYEYYLNNIFARYASSLIHDQRQYEKSLKYLCRITKINRFKTLSEALKNWSDPDNDRYDLVKDLDAQSCPSLYNLNK